MDVLSHHRLQVCAIEIEEKQISREQGGLSSEVVDAGCASGVVGNYFILSDPVNATCHGRYRWFGSGPVVILPQEFGNFRSVDVGRFQMSLLGGSRHFHSLRDGSRLPAILKHWVTIGRRLNVPVEGFAKDSLEGNCGYACDKGLNHGGRTGHN